MLTVDFYKVQKKKKCYCGGGGGWEGIKLYTQPPGRGNTVNTVAYFFPNFFSKHCQKGENYNNNKSAEKPATFWILFKDGQQFPRCIHRSFLPQDALKKYLCLNAFGTHLCPRAREGPGNSISITKILGSSTVNKFLRKFSFFSLSGSFPSSHPLPFLPLRSPSSRSCSLAFITN